MNQTQSNVANSSKLNAKMNLQHILQHKYYEHPVAIFAATLNITSTSAKIQGHGDGK